MQVTETLTEGLKRGFTVVVPAADIEGRRAAKLSEIGRTLRLPGFRPGKVPLPVVRQRFGTAVMAEVVQESVDSATQQMLSERGLRPAMRPKIDFVAKPGVDSQPGSAADLEFRLELEVLPDIPMPEFASIALTRLRVEPPAEAVDGALGTIASRQAELVDVTEDRGAAPGDTLVVDYRGLIDEAEFSGGTGTDMPVAIGDGGFIPGFGEGMVGMRPGEQRSIAVTFPAEYGVKELAGKPARFEVTAKALRQKLPPVVDEALAEKLGVESLEKLRDLVRARMQSEYDQLSRQRLKRALLDALAAGARFAVPDGMVEAEFNAIWQRVEADLKAGTADAEDQGRDEATLRAEYRAIAERRVRLGLLLSEIGRTHGIVVSQEEMSRAMRSEAQRYPGQEAEVLEFFRKTPQAAESLRGPIFEDKVVDFVLELAAVTDQVVSAEELAREDSASADGPAVQAAAPAPDLPAPEESDAPLASVPAATDTPETAG